MTDERFTEILDILETKKETEIRKITKKELLEYIEILEGVIPKEMANEEDEEDPSHSHPELVQLQIDLDETKAELEAAKSEVSRILSSLGQKEKDYLGLLKKLEKMGHTQEILFWSFVGALGLIVLLLII